MPVLPCDFDTSSSGDVDLHGFRIGFQVDILTASSPGSKFARTHKFSISQHGKFDGGAGVPAPRHGKPPSKAQEMCKSFHKLLTVSDRKSETLCTLSEDFARPRTPVPPSFRSLLAPQAEPQARPKIRPQRRVSDDLLVMPIECILDIDVSRYARLNFVPSADIDAGIAGSMR